MKEIIPNKIIEIVSNVYNISIKDIVGKDKKREKTEPRFVAINLICNFCSGKNKYWKGESIQLREIAELFSNRDHTSIINARDRCLDYLHTFDYNVSKYNRAKALSGLLFANPKGFDQSYKFIRLK